MITRIPFVIAEFGSCHMGNFNNALRGIEVAKAADADAFKVQLWTSPARMRERRRVEDPTAYDIGSIPVAWLPLLQDKAKEAGLEFLCTVYLPEDIEIIAPYVDRFKIASFEALDADFVDAHGPYNKQVIISTGMQEENELEDNFSPAIDDVRLLHCVSAYPTPLEQAGLRNIIDGYSDHTCNLCTGGFAVSAGAEILEVHFRLDDTSETCPDYPVALSPNKLAQYITLARLAHMMRGYGEKHPQPSELVNMKHRVI